MKSFHHILRTLILIFFLLGGYSQLGAQQGQTGIGLRLGSDPGITVKHFVRENGAIEGILHTGYRGVLVTGLYEWHKGIGETPALKLYGGVGGHFGVFNRHGYYYRRHGHHYDVIYVHNRPSVGVDAIVGINYDFQEIPLGLSLDLKPAVDFYAGHGYTYLDGALSVRVLC